jgi:hypothetical protein
VSGSEQPKLTVVSAPAGFGKTTLLTEWFTEGRRPAAWVSLDPRDSDIVRFWSYVIASLRVVLPEVGDEAEALLQSDPKAVESVVASLVNDLDTLASDLVLVLDDYHVIESADVHESLAFFLEHLPPQVHLVLAGRSDPALPLARMRARGELLEIRAADLRFSPAETSAYFREAMGFALSDEDLRALEARTEGWIAALQLAALSLRDREDVSGFIASFTGDDRFVVDYLVEEVLERQTPEVREFLLATSVLARLTGPLCEAVTGGTGGAATLDMLDRANLFVVPLDDQRRWYRYHHLFADVLRARLLGERPELAPELHRRACDWYDRNGDWADAIGHAMAGADFESAARLIELATPAMRQARQESKSSSTTGPFSASRSSVRGWGRGTPPGSSPSCRTWSDGSMVSRTHRRARSCSTRPSFFGSRRRSQCTALGCRSSREISPRRSATPASSSSWPNPPITSGSVVLRLFRVSLTGQLAHWYEPPSSTGTPSNASSPRTSSPTLSAARSPSPTSNSHRAASVMHNEASSAVSASRRGSPGSAAPLTCTPG